MNADGSDMNQIAEGDSPILSPDGSRFAFFNNDPFGFWVKNLDGSGETLLTDQQGTYLKVERAWSPDSQKIAFGAALKGNDNNYQIYVVNADGSNLTRLTYSPSRNLNNQPAWSPDGQKIAFVSSRDGNSEIYTMNSDGSNQIRLTNNPGEDIFPRWPAPSTFLPITTSITGIVTDGHGHPLVDVFVGLLDVDANVLVKTIHTEQDGSFRFESPEPNKTYRVWVTLRDSQNSKRILWGNPGLLVNVRTAPFSLTSEQNSIVVDVNFGDSSLESEPIEGHELDDLAAIYFHTQQVEDFVISVLRFEDYYPVSEIRTFRRSRCGGAGAKYSWPTNINPIAHIEVLRETSSWEHPFRPLNREWHESFHHLMYVAMPGGKDRKNTITERLRTDYGEA